MGTVHRQRAVLGLQPRNFPHLLGRAKAIRNGLRGHPGLFVDPQPSLETLDEGIESLDLAQQAAGTRAMGTASMRNFKASELITSLEIARTYVQTLADASPEQGAVLIEAAAMAVAQVTGYRKPVLQAKQSAPGSNVHLLANVRVLRAGMRGKVFFNWQYSSDGGDTWTTAPPTPNGDTEIEGLTPMMTYLFRVSVTCPKSTSPWSQGVALLVL